MALQDELAFAYHLDQVQRKRAQAIDALRVAFEKDPAMKEEATAKLREFAQILHAGRLCHITQVSAELLAKALA